MVPALIHKCHLAKGIIISCFAFVLCSTRVVPSTLRFTHTMCSEAGKNLVIFGSGKPLRQFIFSDDLAKLMLWVLDHYDEAEPLILAPDEKDEVSR